MLDGVRELSGGDGEFAQFLAAGTHATGQFHCSSCGYGVTIHAELPTCPMCGGDAWEAAPWSPLSRALERQ